MTTAQYTPENLDLLRRYIPIAVPHSPELLTEYLIVRGTCWIWTHAIDTRGYGILHMQDPTIGVDSTTTIFAHRYMYNTLVGPITHGSQVHHHCKVPSCWNPAHLEAVTPKEHKARHKKSITP